jgi:hypothetical protein
MARGDGPTDVAGRPALPQAGLAAGSYRREIPTRESLGWMLVDELLAEVTGPGERRAVERVLRRWAGQRVRMPHPEHPGRSLARLLALAGTPARVIVARLVESHGASERTAWRWARTAQLDAERTAQAGQR